MKVDLSRGDTVGELSVLAREKRRSTSAVCLRDSELVRISLAAFERIAALYPHVMRHFARALARRYEALAHKIHGAGGVGVNAGSLLAEHTIPRTGREMALSGIPRPLGPADGSRLAAGAASATGAYAAPASPHMPLTLPPGPNASHFITIAVVGAGGTPCSISDFTGKLVQALEGLGEGTVLHLTSSKLDLMLGDGTAGRLQELFVRAKVAAWLSTQEEKHRFVVFEADAHHTMASARGLSSSGFGRSSSGGGGLGGSFGPEGLPHTPTYSDLMRALVTKVRGAGKGIGARVKHLGHNIDTAVRAGIGISPSAIFNSTLGLATGGSSGGGARQEEMLLRALQSLSTGGQSDGSAGAHGDAHADDDHHNDGPQATPWTKLCVQQADLCLLVGQCHTSPDLSIAEKQCVFKVDASSAAAHPATAPHAPATQPAHASRRSIPANPVASATDLLGFNPGPVVYEAPSAAVAASGSAPAAVGGAGTGSGAAALHASGHDELGPNGHIVARSLCTKHLVLLHPDPSRRPAGTRNWLRIRKVSWHHHVRTLVDEDFSRIARHIAGKARGVVLGGGGSRGLAHLGLLDALENRHAGIDVIGGTSQGAFMAACYAMTLSTKQCIPLVRRLADTIGSTYSLVTSLTLPILSYFSGTAFSEWRSQCGAWMTGMALVQCFTAYLAASYCCHADDALIDCFKDTQIEDLWIHYFCVSTVRCSRMHDWQCNAQESLWCSTDVALAVHRAGRHERHVVRAPDGPAVAVLPRVDDGDGLAATALGPQPQ